MKGDLFRIFQILNKSPQLLNLMLKFRTFCVVTLLVILNSPLTNFTKDLMILKKLLSIYGIKFVPFLVELIRISNLN